MAAATGDVVTDKPDNRDKASSKQQQTQEPDRRPTVRGATDKLPATALKGAATRSAGTRLPPMKVVVARLDGIREAVAAAGADSKALPERSGGA